MAKYKFSSDLSVKGIKNMIKQLEHYRDVELPKKVERYVTTLAQEGILVGKDNVGGFGKYITFSYKTEPCNRPL